MLTRFGHVPVRGLYSLAGFIELDHKAHEQAAAHILERLALNEGQPKDHYTKPAPAGGNAPPHTAIPNNLPRLHSFFGRGDELKTIANASRPRPARGAR